MEWTDILLELLGSDQGKVAGFLAIALLIIPWILYSLRAFKGSLESKLVRLPMAMWSLLIISAEALLYSEYNMVPVLHWSTLAIFITSAVLFLVRKPFARPLRWMDNRDKGRPNRLGGIYHNTFIYLPVVQYLAFHFLYGILFVFELGKALEDKNPVAAVPGYGTTHVLLLCLSSAIYILSKSKPDKTKPDMQTSQPTVEALPEPDNS